MKSSTSELGLRSENFEEDKTDMLSSTTDVKISLCTKIGPCANENPADLDSSSRGSSSYLS